MSEWITKDELLSYVSEYGQNSYDAILYVHDDGYLQLDASHLGAISNSEDCGKFMIIVQWGDE